MFFSKGVNFMAWINALTIGWFGGVLVVILSSQGLEAIGIEHQQYILGVFMGGGVSYMEWLALRKYGVSARWILLCVLGMSLPFLLQSISKFDMGGLDEYAVLPIMIGTGALITGITQHRLIKSHGIKLSRSVQLTMFAWILPVVMVNGATLIPKDAVPLWVNFILNLAAIVGSGPVYAVLKFQIVKSMFKEQTNAVFE